MENDAHLILQPRAQRNYNSMYSRNSDDAEQRQAGKCRAKYDFVPLETHQTLCYLGMRDTGLLTNQQKQGVSYINSAYSAPV